MIEGGLLVFVVGEFFLQDGVLLAEAFDEDSGLSQLRPQEFVFFEELKVVGVVLAVHILNIKFYNAMEIGQMYYKLYSALRIKRALILPIYFN